VCGVIAAGVLLRAALFSWDDVPFIYSDTGSYLSQSATLVPAYDRPLGYAFFLKSVLAVDHSLHTVVYIQTVMGIVMVAGFAGIARRFILNTNLGWILFTVLLALDLRVILFERYILSESLSMFLLVPYFYFLYRAVERNDFASYIYTGIFATLLLMVRSVLAFVVPFSLIVAVLCLSNVNARSLTKRIRAVAIVLLGFIPLAIGYGAYYQLNNGRFAITTFDGFSLWAATGQASVCKEKPWDHIKTVICNSRYANDKTAREFRNIWRLDGPVEDLRRQIADRAVINDGLRSLAIESIRLQPMDYLEHIFAFATSLFARHVRYTEHMKWVLDSNGAAQVRSRFGPDHPSVQESPPENWNRLRPLMKVSGVYGILLLITTVALIFRRLRKRNHIILIGWVWGYILTASMFGSSSAERLYVVMTAPLLLSGVGFLETLLTQFRPPRELAANSRKVP